MARVSVIIPCYNHGRYLGEAVASVLAQTYDDYEIIIVNDGSTDPETNTLLASWDSPKTRVIQTDNQGLAAARNNGIREAGGEYILPLDADDRIGETYLAKAVKVLDAENEVGIVYCRARLFGARDADWNLPEFSLQEMLVDNVIFCSAVFRRSDWDLAGGYDTGLTYGWEDYDLWLSLLELGRKVYQIPEILFYYRVSADSMVRARPRRHKLETFAGIYRKHHQFFSDNIEVWVDRLLDSREIYHESRIFVGSTINDEADAGFSRKVGTGTTRLEFELGSNTPEKLIFQPAGDCTIVSLQKVALVTSGGEEHEVAWLAKADLVEGDTCFFAGPSPVVECTLPDDSATKQHAGKKLVVELEYHCIGKECVPFLLEKYIQKTGTGGEKPLAGGVSGSSGTQAERKGIAKLLHFFCNRQHREHYRCLSESSLFDAGYYRRKYGDLNRFFRVFPLAHYIYTGWRENRCPNEFFELLDREWYVEGNPDADGIDPLLHFIKTGCSPENGLNPLFFDEYYLETYLGGSAKGPLPIQHFQTAGWQEGANPNPFFDTRFYQAENRDAVPEGMNPLLHYIHSGFDEPVHPLPFFDTRYYLEDNPAVARQRLPLLYHYVRFGAQEGRSPNRFFDPVYYRRENGLDDRTGWKAFEHYVTTGCRENLRPGPLFDPVFYAEQYPQYRESHLYPVLHYQDTGVFEGNYPCREIADLAEKPVISILTPVYNTDEHLLRRCIHSVLYQAYPHWELCLVDDGSSKEHVRKVLEEYADLDSRIKVRSMRENKGISAASNEAAAMATGEYVGFLDHDDELTLDALYEIAGAINDRDPDVLYTDEDLVNLESRYQETFYKPDFNPVLLQCHNYITHFLVTRRALFEAVGGFSDEYSGAQDYDLFLKLVEKSKKTIHLPRVVYHWRAHETSTSINHRQKQYADEAGRKALAAALKRRGLGGTAEKTGLKFFYRVDHDFSMGPKISIICASAGDRAGTGASVRSIVQSTEYENFEIILPEAHAEIIASQGENAREDRNLRLVEWSGNMSEPAWTNRAAEEAEGEYLVFLDPALTLQDKDWLTALLAYAHREETGLAGGRIDYPQSDIQHTGTVPDISITYWYYYVSFVRDVSVHLNGMHCPQNVQYVPETLCMIRRDRFLDVGGFSAQFSLAPFAGLDLCQRLSERGFMHVYTPYCRARADNAPLEHGIAMTDTDAAAREKSLFQEKWHARLVAGDPFYNRMVLADKSISLDDFLSWYTGLPGTG
jgi:glycosyltransferase involved in cell wall biosynthesis